MWLWLTGGVINRGAKRIGEDRQHTILMRPKHLEEEIKLTEKRKTFKKIVHLIRSFMVSVLLFPTNLEFEI